MAAASLVGFVLTASACYRLNFWPKPGEWGRISWKQFRELFGYGTELFVITLGVQLMTSSQTILIARVLGVEAAALWSVMTKPFTLVNQLVWRVISNAMPAFAEMYVRNEIDLMWRRYQALFITTSGLAGAAGLILAACNGTFVGVWMHKEFGWPPLNDALLGLWLIALTQQCCHISFISCLKQIGYLKYVYLIEGLFFVVLTLSLARHTGLTGVLANSVAATFLCTWLVSSWRVARMLKSPLKVLIWDWQLPLFKVLAVLGLSWLLVASGLQWVPLKADGALTVADYLHLIIPVCILVPMAGWALARFALPRNLASEVAGRLPSFLQRPVLYFALRSRHSPDGDR